MRRNYVHTNDIISASEVGQYTYCSIAWYLQRCGYEPEPSASLEHGLKVHKELGKTLESVQKESCIARRYAMIGYLLLILAIIIVLLEVMVF